MSLGINKTSFVNLFAILKNMGPRYLLFRIGYLLLQKSGLRKLQYPRHIKMPFCISFGRWKIERPHFFFDSRNAITLPRYNDDEINTLKDECERIQQGVITFFSSTRYDLGTDYDWMTNPLSGYRYNPSVHWSRTNEFDSKNGDIKFVWEKSRFSYLWTIIRYDALSGSDSSPFVFSEIQDWIDKNPLNYGPNYRCSQEISLRVMNWISALYFYTDSKILTEEFFATIMHSMYGQILHVEKNIAFSRIAVRNNHAVTESLMLYTAGVLFPWFPESKRWRKKGKQFLEEEGRYQIYADGTYLQHSFNYQRVVAQLYTWALSLAAINDDRFSDTLIARLVIMKEFMADFCDKKTGSMPNHGANDGALFFPLNRLDYSDYRGSINALARVVGAKDEYPGDEFSEDGRWLGTSKVCIAQSPLPFKAEEREAEMLQINKNASSYPIGGYYLLRNDASVEIFIRCASYRNRPFHADNLHCDIKIGTSRLIRDSGTWIYNGPEKEVSWFSGSSAHNTVTIEQYNQMRRGSRFIWYDWSDAISASITEDADDVVFCGTIEAFAHVKAGVKHSRTIRLSRSGFRVVVEDRVTGWDGVIVQHWHPTENFSRMGILISCCDGKDSPVVQEEKKGWNSPLYGYKTESPHWQFSTGSGYLKTIFTRQD